MDTPFLTSCIRLFGEYLEEHAEEIAHYVATGVEKDYEPTPEPEPPPKSVDPRDPKVADRLVGLDVMVTEYYTGTTPYGYRGRITEYTPDHQITVLMNPKTKCKYYFGVLSERWLHPVNKTCYKVDIIPLHSPLSTDTL